MYCRESIFQAIICPRGTVSKNPAATQPRACPQIHCLPCASSPSFVQPAAFYFHPENVFDTSTLPVCHRLTSAVAQQHHDGFRRAAYCQRGCHGAVCRQQLA